MPVENERKYVLPPHFDAQVLSGWSRHDIRQAYLDENARIRWIDSDCLFTYKRWVPQAREQVEIETAISRDDFDLLWPLCVQSVQKTRYVRQVADAEWVVDLLSDASGTVYFVLAEVELPRFQAAPDSIIAEIREHIVYSVAIDDNRFTNKKLSDPAYAARLLAEVTP